MRYVFISRKNTRLRTKNNNNSFAFYQQTIIQKNFFRSDIIYHKLPEIYLELNRLKKEIDELKQKKQ